MLNIREQEYRRKLGGFAGLSDVGKYHSQSGTVLMKEAPPIDRMADSSEILARPEWRLACRVAASKGFCKSEFLPKFLIYICEQYLMGTTEEITEQRIGTQIFNRSTEYSPGEDNIVRSYARLLRKRLDGYFEGEGRHEPMRIVVPKGGYVPIFPASPTVEVEGTSNPELQEREKRNAFSELPELPASPEKRLDRAKARLGSLPWLLILLGIVIGGLTVSAVWMGVRSVQMQQEQSVAHPLWTQMFQRSRNTLIVPADSGLGILENLSNHLVTLEEYTNGAYLSELKSPAGLDPENFNDLRRQRYTSVVNLDITSMLIRLPEFVGNRTQVRYAREITAEDIKNSNTILLGSPHTNPWVSLFEKKLNFKLEYTPQVNRSYVINQNPVESEQKTYLNDTSDTSNRTYGAIAFLPGLDGSGHVLIIQGLNMAATQAAADTLFNAEQIQPVLQEATLPNGLIKPFELLVETKSIGATASGSQIIAVRFYTQ